jgi:hypothetical protein
LVSDWLSADTDLKLLHGFCTLAPAKILFVGAAALLTMSFWGGFQEFPKEEWDFQEFPEEEQVRLAPKTHHKLGLVVGVGDAPPSLAVQVQVIKGDTQKADSANVPEHLWVYAVVCGYGPGAHRPRHLGALGLPPMTLVGGLSNPTPPEGWEFMFSGLSKLALFWLHGLSCWWQQVLCGFLCLEKMQLMDHQGVQSGTDGPSCPCHEKWTGERFF